MTLSCIDPGALQRMGSFQAVMLSCRAMFNQILCVCWGGSGEQRLQALEMRRGITRSIL